MSAAEEHAEVAEREAKEAVRRMDEALAKQYDAIQAYEGKIQDLARETLRNSALRQELTLARGRIGELVASVDRHKAEIGRLRALLCECGHGGEPGDLHDDECPARP